MTTRMTILGIICFPLILGAQIDQSRGSLERASRKLYADSVLHIEQIEAYGICLTDDMIEWNGVSIPVFFVSRDANAFATIRITYLTMLGKIEFFTDYTRRTSLWFRGIHLYGMGWMEYTFFCGRINTSKECARYPTQGYNRALRCIQ